MRKRYILAVGGLIVGASAIVWSKTCQTAAEGVHAVTDFNLKAMISTGWFE